MTDLVEMKGFYVNPQTSPEVASVLSKVHGTNERIRVFYGDAKTGLCWLEENDVIGTIGRSTGKMPIPLLIRKRNSLGGGGILTHCIVRITTKRNGGILNLYQHPDFHLPELTQVGCEVFSDGNIHARFKNEIDANNFIDFLKGDRNRK